MTPEDRIRPRDGRRPAARRGPLRRVAAALAGASLAAAAVALVGLAQGSGPDGALSASAHNYLVSSSPAAGSTIDAPPSEVTLTFNDVILDLGTAGGAGAGDATAGSAPAAGGSSVVQVTGPDDRHFETGCATDAGRAVSVPVALGASGEYRVTWRVVSADGHPVSDSIAFTYQAPAGAEAAAGTADGPGCAAVSPGGSASSGGSAGSADAGSSAADPGTAAGQEQGVAPYLGVIVGVGIGIVVLAAAAVVLIVVTGRRKPAGAAATDAARDPEGGPPGA
ncbi:copper resistance CopC family protein [Clavibacter capsici]|uniref:Copper resistance protein CopC n=1 Tax=Clavibacter capsici TaxID=1874630 RepID=A0AAE7CB70_9MICO|nr:copper resistance CopC family protein [Clavibacter capsici]QIS44051.1 copper resistance protein CopC [Clavibacter capsici]